MYLSRVQIKNLRNFRDLDVTLSGDMVMVGENRVGKSNFIFALRLVLDAGVSDAVRQLKLADIFDGADLSKDPKVEVHLDFREFDKDLSLLALLTDYRLPADHNIARLSYVFTKRADVQGPAGSDADYEFKVFGGDDETRTIRTEVRRRISLTLLPALRDAENDLASWRSSPLRPLLEDAISTVPGNELAAVANDLTAAANKLGALAPIKALEGKLRGDIATLSGSTQDIKAKLGFGPSDPLRLFRSIGLYIDDGKRGIADASLGSSNLALLALRLAEFEWRKTKNERNFTFLCIEEPEAHLHPHLQRKVFKELFKEDPNKDRSLLLTTHSPNVVSVAPLRSVVLLRPSEEGTKGYSLAKLDLAPSELEDLQRYINTTRADLLFSRAVIFVEGDSEEALLPVFASSLGHDLDELGVMVCNVAGTNFSPYVKLALALGIRHAVVTDWDPLDGSKPPLGKGRALGLLDDRLAARGIKPLPQGQRANLEKMTDVDFRARMSALGVFLNSSTLELEVANSSNIRDPLLSILEDEKFGSIRRKRIKGWKAGTTPIDAEQLLAMVADIGKGRLAGRLAAKAVGLPPPGYIDAAIKHVLKNV